jgi:hypothetical protein
MALLPSIVIAPRVLSGEFEVGRIVEATGAFSAIMGSLTILVDNIEGLAGFAAGISRVRTLNSRLKRAGKPILLAAGHTSFGCLRIRLCTILRAPQVGCPWRSVTITTDFSSLIACGLWCGARLVFASPLFR